MLTRSGSAIAKFLIGVAILANGLGCDWVEIVSAEFRYPSSYAGQGVTANGTFADVTWSEDIQEINTWASAEDLLARNQVYTTCPLIGGQPVGSDPIVDYMTLASSQGERLIDLYQGCGTFALDDSGFIKSVVDSQVIVGDGVGPMSIEFEDGTIVDLIDGAQQFVDLGDLVEHELKGFRFTNGATPDDVRIATQYQWYGYSLCRDATGWYRYFLSGYTLVTTCSGMTEHQLVSWAE